MAAVEMSANDGDALSALGLRQVAFECTQKAATFAAFGAPDVVYCSPLLRTMHTACAAFPGARIVADPRLVELGGACPGRARAAAALLRAVGADAAARVDLGRVPEAGVAADAGEDVYPPRGAPPGPRLAAFLEELAASAAARVAVVGHSSWPPVRAGNEIFNLRIRCARRGELVQP